MQNKKIIIIILVIAAVAAGCVVVFAAPLYDAYFSDKTVHNIKFMDKDIGALTKNEVEKLVDEASNAEHKAVIEVSGTNFEIDTLKSGIILNKEATVEKIMSFGKNNLFDAMNARKGLFVEPVYEKNVKALEDVVNSKLSENNISYQKYVVDIGASTADYTILVENANIDYNDLSEKLLKICVDNNAEEKISATFEDFKWPDAEELRTDFDIPVQDAKVSVENGIRKYQSHVVGRKLDFDILKKNLDEKNVKFSVPYKKINPSVYTDDLGDELFPDLLGKFTTYYSEGNVGRSVNVKLAASKINGHIMNAGDVFSFNQVVGKRNYANGFKDAAVYSANGVENGVGGGICQVSSTLYPAVLYADLKIVERRNHSYTVAYAAPGLDATVSYGTIDFRFSNNKKNPIKIAATASNGAMTVRIYGTKENNNVVELDAKTIKVTPRGEKRIFDSSLPVGTSKIENAGFDGAVAQVYKYIKSPDGAVISSYNLGISTYISLNKVIKYNDGNEAEEKVNEKTTAEENVSEKPEEKPPEQTSQQPEQTQSEQTKSEQTKSEQTQPAIEAPVTEATEENRPSQNASEKQPFTDAEQLAEEQPSEIQTERRVSEEAEGHASTVEGSDESF